MACRIYDALVIIRQSCETGSRNDYEGTLRVLRAHGFKAEQARYIVDLLMKKYDILAEFEDGDDTYIDVDGDSEATKALAKHYEEGHPVFLA